MSETAFDCPMVDIYTARRLATEALNAHCQPSDHERIKRFLQLKWSKGDHFDLTDAVIPRAMEESKKFLEWAAKEVAEQMAAILKARAVEACAHLMVV